MKDFDSLLIVLARRYRHKKLIIPATKQTTDKNVVRNFFIRQGEFFTCSKFKTYIFW
jgi:hypothetical protein